MIEEQRPEKRRAKREGSAAGTRTDVRQRRRVKAARRLCTDNNESQNKGTHLSVSSTSMVEPSIDTWRRRRERACSAHSCWQRPPHAACPSCVHAVYTTVYIEWECLLSMALVFVFQIWILCIYLVDVHFQVLTTGVSVNTRVSHVRP